MFTDPSKTATLFWYRADVNAPVLPFPSSVTSLDWELEPWVTSPIGEVYGTPRPFSYRAFPSYAGAGHICGTEDMFTRGCEYTTVPPPAEYDQHGVGLCCPPHYGNVYRLGNPGDLRIMKLVNTDEEWFYSAGPGSWTLFSPRSGFTDGTRWILVLGGGLCTFSAPATWDGEGSQVFTPYTGTCAFTETVTRIG